MTEEKLKPCKHYRGHSQRSGLFYKGVCTGECLPKLSEKLNQQLSQWKNLAQKMAEYISWSDVSESTKLWEEYEKLKKESDNE